VACKFFMGEKFRDFFCYEDTREMYKGKIFCEISKEGNLCVTYKKVLFTSKVVKYMEDALIEPKKS
jgi:hypothetical protein